MIMAGTCFLHLWQNFGGELTRFADRQCYGVSVKCVNSDCELINSLGGGVWIFVHFIVSGIY